jgi:Domain of unknown function (DUF4279)
VSGDNVIQFPSRSISIGGPIDSAKASLCIHGEDLDPDEITRILGLAPTHSHRRGDRRRPKSPPAPMGFWGYEVDSADLDQAADATRAPADLSLGRLLDRLPSDPALWAGLAQQYQMRIFFCIAFEGYNKGFGLSAGNIQRAAVLGVPLDFDLYADDNFPPELEGLFDR